MFVAKNETIAYNTCGGMDMAIVDRNSILRVLTAYNPWWKTGILNPIFSKTYKRFAYYEAMRRLENTTLRRSVVLTGARRVGKTTIQYQMIESLLKKGVPPQKILFVSMDHPMLKLAQFQDVLDIYHENICATQDVYYFFDEIQYAQDWDRWMKTIYDSQPETKMVATGSASPALMKGSSESGTGRWSVIPIPTLSFYEYCSLIGIEGVALPKNFHPTDMLEMSQQERGGIMLKLSGVQNHLNRYLTIGGFPELALAQNDLMAQQMMREDVVDKVLKRDLPSLYGLRNATELERIFLYLCNVSSNVVSIDAVTKELNGVSRPTVEKYIGYLESANLIYVSYPIDMRDKKVLKASPKIYISDAAIRNAVLMDDDILTNPVEMGKMVETAVYKHVTSFFYQKATRVGYYRGGRASKEIDIVVAAPGAKRILIEVKYREEAPIANDDAICELCDEADASIIVTKRANDFGVHNAPNGKKLLRIPAFAFLYLLGYAEKNGEIWI